MTLRELIKLVIECNGFEQLSDKIVNIHPEWVGQKQQDVMKTYRRVAIELEDLPGDDELKGHTIVIDEIENTLSDQTEKWVDVHLSDPDNDKWSIDMTDWNGLIDLPVQDNVFRSLTDRLAHILYEITFWGTTRQSVLHECEQLHQMTENKNNLIEVTMEEFLAEVDNLK